MGNKQKRAKCCQLKEKVENEHIIREHQTVHRAQKQHHHKEELMLSGFFQLEVCLVIFHVGDGLKADECTDNGNNQHHNKRKMIAIQDRGGLFVLNHEKLEVNQENDLQKSQGYNKNMAVFESEIQNDQ